MDSHAQITIYILTGICHHNPQGSRTANCLCAGRYLQQAPLRW
ncbi:MAG: hypothetical protein AABX52_03080 [Nanoarchaeota archaeon]